MPGFDPLGPIDDPEGNPMIGVYAMGGAGRKRTPEYRRPLIDEEKSGVAEQLAGHATGLLQEGLHALSWPKRQVFHAHAGPRADEGRDVLDKWGVTSRNDKGWGAWGAGLAADIFGDPLTYVSLGPKTALTATGKLARAAGELRGLSRAEVIGKGLGGLVGFGLPWRDPAIVLGKGAVGKGIARGLDVTGDFLRYGNPVGTQLGSLFDRTAGEATEGWIQKGFARHGVPAGEAAEETARRNVYNLRSGIGPAISGATGTAEREALDATKRVAEGLGHGLEGPYHPDVLRSVEESGAELGQVLEDYRRGDRRIGIAPAGKEDQFVRSVPRERIAAGGEKRGPWNMKTLVGHLGSIPDEAVFRNAGGQTRADSWARRFAGLPYDPATRTAIYKDLVEDYEKLGLPLKLNPKLDASFQKRAEALTVRLAKLNPEHRLQQIGLYNPDVVGGLERAGTAYVRGQVAGHAAIGTLADNVKHISRAANPDDFVPLSQTLSALKLKTWQANPALGRPIEGAGAEMIRRLNLDPALLNGKLGPLTQALDEHGLTLAQHNALVKRHGVWSAPEVVKGPLRFFDSATNAFKNLTYPLWIPSHVRNMFGGTVNNIWRHGPVGAFLGDRTAGRVIGGKATAAELRGLLPGLQAGVTDEAARDLVKREAFATGGIFGGLNAATERVGSDPSLLTSGGRITPGLPGADANINPVATWLGGLGRQVATTGGKLANPFSWFDKSKPWGLGMAGVGGATQDTMPLLRAGRKTGESIENRLRLGDFLASLKEGIAPSEAGKLVNDLHFNYGNSTDFERKVMKRIFPFYTFASRNIPLQLHMAASRPGMTLAQMKLMSSARGPDDYVPDDLASGAAVPLGTNADGTQRYLSGFGLPLEEAMQRFQFRDRLPDVRGTARQWMGMVNPLLRAPVEQLTNLHFFSGRPLDEQKLSPLARPLEPWIGTGGARLGQQVLENTPFSRFASTANKMLDERRPAWQKALNLLSGVRISDVDSEKARAMEARDAALDIARTMPHLSPKPRGYYVKPENQPLLTPEEIRIERILNAQERASQAYAKQERQRAARIGVAR
jgi:hypothetical protein